MRRQEKTRRVEPAGYSFNDLDAVSGGMRNRANDPG
jgi:hypothetical protein